MLLLCLDVVHSIEGVSEGRLRHHAALVKMGKSNRRVRAASAGERAPPREREPGIRLMPYTVAQKTALNSYLPGVRSFLEYALTWDLPVMTPDDIDRSICLYFDALLDDESGGPHKGDAVVHGMVFLFPELGPHLPRAHRSLRGWHRIYVHGEGGPQPMEIWALVGADLRSHGQHESADALAVALDCYLRASEIFGLRAEDVLITDQGRPEQLVSLRLGVIERGERTKTGARQGVLVDWPDTADILVNRKHNRKPGDKLFAVSVDTYRRDLQLAARRLGLPDLGPAHSVRHSGPSADAEQGYRSIWQIQRRGRRASEKSVMRYAKTHTLHQAKAAFNEDTLARGAALLRQRRLTPATARE